MKNKEYIFAGITILLWGCLATVSKLIMNSMDSMNALFYTCLFATLVLFLFNLVKGNFKKLQGIKAGTVIKMVLIGSLGVFFYNYFYLEGTLRLPAQEAFVINDLWPALIIVFSCIILKEKMTVWKAVAVILSFLGIMVVVTNGHLFAFRLKSVSGTLFCLGAALCYSLYSVLGKKETYDKGLAVFIAYASGTVVALIVALCKGSLGLPKGWEWGGVAFNGIFINGLAYLFWAMALDIGNTAIIANLAYLVPFVSLILTHFVLGEEITLFSILGLLLIVAGIVLQYFAEKSGLKRKH